MSSPPGKGGPTTSTPLLKSTPSDGALNRSSGVKMGTSLESATSVRKIPSTTSIGSGTRSVSAVFVASGRINSNPDTAASPKAVARSSPILVPRGIAQTLDNSIVADAPQRTTCGVLSAAIKQRYRHAMGRMKEVVGQMPLIAKVFLIVLFLIDYSTVAYLSLHKKETSVHPFRIICFGYVIFQYGYAFYAVYAQNEYTLAASVALFIIASVYMTLDWKQGLTGLSIELWTVIVQWTCAAYILVSSVGVYRGMEGFGWKPYRELGARQDRIAVHTAYKKFTAVLAIDFFASVMTGLLTTTLASWPTWMMVAAIAAFFVVPVLGAYPLKKAVRNEWALMLKCISLLYSSTVVVILAVLVFVILHVRGKQDIVHISHHTFPVSTTLIISSSATLLIRLSLYYFLHLVVAEGFGKGILSELDVARKLRKEPTSGTYGTLGSGSPSVRFDFVSTTPIQSQPIVNRDSSIFISSPIGDSLPFASPAARTPVMGRSFQPEDGGMFSTTPGNTPSMGPVPILDAKAVVLSKT